MIMGGFEYFFLAICRLIPTMEASQCCYKTTLQVYKFWEMANGAPSSQCRVLLSSTWEIWHRLEFYPYCYGTYSDVIKAYIMVGFCLQILTNGMYKSVIHRAIVNKAKTRMSIVSFYNTLGDTVISPMQSLLDATNQPPVYRSVTFDEHFKNFLSRGRNLSLEGVRNTDLYKI